MGILRSFNIMLLVGLATVFASAAAEAGEFPTLDSALDRRLQQAMDKSLQKIRLDHAVAEKRLAVRVLTS